MVATSLSAVGRRSGCAPRTELVLGVAARRHHSTKARRVAALVSACMCCPSQPDLKVACMPGSSVRCGVTRAHRRPAIEARPG